MSVNIPAEYEAGSDSMYAQIHAPTLEAALADMNRALRGVGWADPYIDYIMGNRNSQRVRGIQCEHTIQPVQVDNSWILEIPAPMAADICWPMVEWFETNPGHRSNVDLLTKEQASQLNREVV